MKKMRNADVYSTGGANQSRTPEAANLGVQYERLLPG